MRGTPWRAASKAARRRSRSLTRYSQAPAGPSTMNQKITPKIRLLACTKIASSTASRAPAPPRRRAWIRAVPWHVAWLRRGRAFERTDVVVHLVLQVARTERKQQHDDGEGELQQVVAVAARASAMRAHGQRRHGQQGEAVAIAASPVRPPSARSAWSNSGSSQRSSRRCNRCVRPRSQISAKNSAIRLMPARPRVRNAPARARAASRTRCRDRICGRAPRRCGRRRARDVSAGIGAAKHARSRARASHIAPDSYGEWSVPSSSMPIE